MSTTTTGKAKTTQANKLAKSPITKPATEAKESEVKTAIKEEVKAKNKTNLMTMLDISSELFLAGKKGGNHQDHLFKVGLIPETKKEKTSFRKKVRKNLSKFAFHFDYYSKVEDKLVKTKALSKLKAEFDAYYSKVYRVNDYSLESLIGSGTREGRKGDIVNMLNIIKTIK